MSATAEHVSALATRQIETREVMRVSASRELFFAVVGPVGAGSSHVARQLERCLKSAMLDGKSFTCEMIRASDAIREAHGIDQPERNLIAALRPLERKVAMQGLGDELRRADHAAIAATAVGAIAKARAKSQSRPFIPGEPVQPDGMPRAYVIDSLKHPAEVKLLRRLYGDAFILIGVVCSPPVLEERLAGAMFTTVEWAVPKNKEKLRLFIERDADDPVNKHGQHVSDAFHESDFFVDNTRHVPTPAGKSFKEALDEPLNGELDRLVSIILHDKVRRPTEEEAAMHAAHSAQLQSSCLSRQVGAALMDRHGNIVATGTNEVPKAGGGVYGEGVRVGGVENRCAFCSNGGSGAYCSNNAQQNELFGEAIKALFGEALAPGDIGEKVSLATPSRPSLRIGCLRGSRFGNAVCQAAQCPSPKQPLHRHNKRRPTSARRPRT